eukprot:TRINITY_DN2850_c0_g1_i1.p1 TRINITY_DN2850_c0_g1~~TRINITY_DN2850_c0_g1_i1.p1  ORF type:complete len:376 (-),score=64.77 TRINITY_DN2850_c0_g1_i1:115-1242(-)
MPEGRRQRKPVEVAKGRFTIDTKLGAGCFGEVFLGKNTETGKEVAIKFEEVSCHAPQLQHEADILNLLRQPVQPEGFAELFYFGQEGREAVFNCMVMECLGKSLEDRMQSTQAKRFDTKTTVYVAEQAIRRVEYLHSKGLIHRDIKPENFMFGVRDRQHHLYIIDFGLSKRYYTDTHQPFRSHLNLTGTARYASINAHRGVEQSRRDDLEAIGYMLLYFLRGSLPWSGLQARTKEEKYRKICEKKQSFPMSELCDGFPEEFQTYITYCRNLGYKDIPNYQMLAKLFRNVRSRADVVADGDKEYGFQWPLEPWDVGQEGKKEIGPIVPLESWQRRYTQPDDVTASKDSREGKKKAPGRKGFCFSSCFSAKVVAVED